MSDHLPECPQTERAKYAEPLGGPGPFYGPCICDRLRACEARVRRDVDDVWVTQHDDHITWEWKGDTGYALVQREVLELLLARCNEPTYAAGVQAARDAVAECRVPWPTATGDLVNEGIDDALAAINALRGES